MGIEPITVVINPGIQNNPINNFALALQTQNVPLTIKHYKPTEHIQSVSRFNGETKLQMADLLRKQCLQSQTAF